MQMASNNPDVHGASSVRRFTYVRKRPDKRDRFDVSLRPLDEYIYPAVSRSSRYTQLSSANAPFTWLPKMMSFATVIGIAIGSLMRLRSKPYTEREILYASMPSRWMESSLTCMFVPLLVSNVFLTLSHLDFKTCVRITQKTFAIVFCSTISATIVGIAVAFTVNPGINAQNQPFVPAAVPNETIVEDMMNAIINTVTTNFVEACMFQAAARNRETTTLDDSTEVRRLSTKYSMYALIPRTNFSGLLFLMLVYGLCASRVRNKLKFLPQMTESIFELSICVIKVIARLSPIGILSSMIMNVLRMPDWGEFPYLGSYLLTIIIAVTIQLLVVVPLIHFMVVGLIPYSLFSKTVEIMLIAFSVPDSLHAVPFTMTFLERTYVDYRIITLVIPFGGGYHKPAAAIHYTVAAIFLAQASGVTLSVVDVFKLSGIAVACSFLQSGFPGVPAMLIQDTAKVIGASPAAVALIYPIFPSVACFLTVVDVLCNCLVASAVHRSATKELYKYDRMIKKFRGNAYSNLSVQAFKS